jgi:hypothetical protein
MPNPSTSAKDIEQLLSRLSEFESRIEYLHSHLKQAEARVKGLNEEDADDQFMQLKTLNSALNRRAVLHRIEKEFETGSTSSFPSSWTK